MEINLLLYSDNFMHLRFHGCKTSHSVAFYRCPNTLSPIWSTDAHVVAGAEMKKKWTPMHVRSPVLQTLKYIIPRSPLYHGVHEHSEAPVPTRGENRRPEASVLYVETKIFFGTAHAVDSLTTTAGVMI